MFNNTSTFFLGAKFQNFNSAACAVCCVLHEMFQALRGRAGTRALLSASTLPLPPRCLANAAAHRCLSKVAAPTPTRKVDPAVPVTASTPAVGQEQDAAGAEGASTKADEMADPSHVLLYEGPKVCRRYAASSLDYLLLSFALSCLSPQPCSR